MKLGIAAAYPHSSPDEWAAAHLSHGLEAVVFPLAAEAAVKDIDAYKKAADDAGLVIAEVGAWCNPLHPDKSKREENRRLCIRQLELAEYVGAGCCVNISGAPGEVWDGAYAENYSEKTYADIVESVRQIIDAVHPSNTFYALEPMPHMLPDSPESYLQMIKDIDRPSFGAHIDLVNMLASPRLFYGNAELAGKCFTLLGPYIRSCHLKDAVLDHALTVSIRETECGKGGVDLFNYIACADACDNNLPMIIEHLPTAADYASSVAYILEGYAKRKGHS